MVIIGKRMIPSLKGVLKSTGRVMLGIIKQARYYDDPSLPSFDPSSNASLHEWGYYINARDLYKSRSIVVYVELPREQDHYVINKVGQTTNLWERRKAETYHDSLLKSVIRLDEVPLPSPTP